MNVLLAATAALLFACGTWLVTTRQLSRIVLGIGLLGHGANLLLLLAGRRGSAPVFGTSDPEGFADPLPQALGLTAIVITFGVTLFLLAMAYRSWQLTGRDEVEDDFEDRFVAANTADAAEVDDEEHAVHAIEQEEGA
ncbi:MAG TPA: sodium:proton antiporter [Acidimicrobiaceae bacterium]|nr:sodium:proton antiporter [Acidimicrobiaceae bacterium]